jgi:molybdate transport system substrate-binding protein
MNMRNALVILCTISTKEALMELVPEFERTSGHPVDITYQAAPALIERIHKGLRGDIFIGPEEYSGPLLEEGILRSRTAFARSTTGLAVRAGTMKPDISTPEQLKRALLAAGSVAYSEGASGMQFVKAMEALGISAAITAKRAAARPGEMVGAVVARGAADIGIQQISALLPVAGIDIVGRLPAALQEVIVYGTNAFAQSSEREAAEAFTNFLRSAGAHDVLRRKGLEPA